MTYPELPWILAVAGWAVALVLTGMLLSARRILRQQYRNPAGVENEVLAGISRQLDSLDRMGERIEGLDRAFRIPRIRGGFGESLLEELLRSWLPGGSWTAQYTFPDGSRADAVVRMGSRLVAIDAKFSLERIEHWLEGDGTTMDAETRRTFVGHARSIAAKYVRPEDGTLSFALMYLPAEGIHYRLLRDDDGSLMRECLSLHVLPVGPLSLFAYLQTVSYGLKGLALPEEGRELRRRIDRVRRDFESLSRPLSTAATHLKNLNSSWQELEKRTGRLSDGLENLDSGDRNN